MLGESRERQTGSSSLQGSCSHGSPFGKRPLLPSPRHPGPMTYYPWRFRVSLAAGQVVDTNMRMGDSQRPAPGPKEKSNEDQTEERCLPRQRQREWLMERSTLGACEEPGLKTLRVDMSGLGLRR